MSWERPRGGGGRARDAARSVTAAESFRSELDGVELRVTRVVDTSRAEFVDGAPAYDAASMAVIRMHAMTERREYAPFFVALGADETAGIRAVRNIAVHRDYDRMDDAILWNVVTRLLPPLLARLRASLRG